MLFLNFFRHLWVVMKHRHKVFIYSVKAGIPWQGLVHDLSKFSPQEFLIGVKYFQKNQSPNVRERIENGYSKAWLHHQGRNKHHFEYWIDYNPATKHYDPIEMPKRYLIEMFCDRLSASKTYQGKNYHNGQPLQYFLGSKDRIMMHENTKKDLETLLIILKEKGEKEVFHYIRNEIKK